VLLGHVATPRVLLRVAAFRRCLGSAVGGLGHSRERGDPPAPRRHDEGREQTEKHDENAEREATTLLKCARHGDPPSHGRRAHRQCTPGSTGGRGGWPRGPDKRVALGTSEVRWCGVPTTKSKRRDRHWRPCRHWQRRPRVSARTEVVDADHRRWSRVRAHALEASPPSTTARDCAAEGSRGVTAGLSGCCSPRSSARGSGSCCSTSASAPSSRQ